MTEHKKVGRPSKGPRNRINLAEPVAISLAVREKCRALGITVTDYYISLAAKDTGVPASPQDGLPFTTNDSSEGSAYRITA